MGAASRAPPLPSQQVRLPLCSWHSPGGQGSRLSDWSDLITRQQGGCSRLLQVSSNGKREVGEPGGLEALQLGAPARRNTPCQGAWDGRWSAALALQPFFSR